MNVLADTNILSALDPTSEEFVQQTTEDAARMVQLAARAGVQLFVHPAQENDFEHDRDERRKRLRRMLAGKYQLLDPAPLISAALANVLGQVPLGSNHYVDHQLLAAVDAPAVDYLITEDKQILRKASRAGLRERVLSLAEAIDVFYALSDHAPASPPAVRSVKAYELNRNDSIWNSFEPDYPGFQDWLAKCAREQRDAWVIDGEGGYATVLIVNRETRPPPVVSGKVLKICTFKASERYHGLRYGELMLKTVFRYAHENRYDWIFIESFPKQEALVTLLRDFGFETVEEKPSNELVLAKPVHPVEGASHLKGLEFNRRYGPHFVDWARPAFFVPIQPQFEALLFPDQQQQTTLLDGQNAFGNAIRKAYLCHANITHVESGSVLLFYRSQDRQALTTLAVAEDTLRSSDPDEIASFVARRTVYSMEDIRKMTKKPVLAIRFRHARQITPHVRLQELIGDGILKQAPQSISAVKEEAQAWLKARIDQ